MPGSILLTKTVERIHGEALYRAAPEMPHVVLRDEDDTPGLAGVEVVYFSGDLYPAGMRPFLLALRQVPALRWLHSFSAGVDDVFFQRLLARGVRLTTSSGAHAVPIAHTVMMYLLALSRDLRGWLADQAERRWNPRDVVELQGRTLGVVGLGPIGLEVARLGQAFRMQVIGLRRSPRGDEPCETWPLSRLHELLARVDDLVLALPLSEETRGVIDRHALSMLRPGSTLVNVGRGDLVDEAALVEALAEGRLRGAGLDVFQREPLPVESPLWSMQSVIVTPHSSGSTPANLDRASEIFVDNLSRYVRGEPLRNEVAKVPA